MALFWKECGKIAKSLVYWLFVGILVFFCYSQFGFFTSKEAKEAASALSQPVENIANNLLKPEKDWQNFGTTSKEIPDQIMRGALGRLIGEYSMNQYVSYPYSFYRSSPLGEEDQAKIKAILAEITGMTGQELDGYLNAEKSKSDNSMTIQGGGSITTIEGGFTVGGEEGQAEGQTEEEGLVPQVEYERFKELMEQVCGIIGKGSSYEMEDMIRYFGQTPATYEDAIKTYGDTIHKDKVTGGYARLFSDYAGIALALFPVFVAALFCMKDRRAKMRELIDSRKASSAKLILCRYSALVLMMLLPVILMGIQQIIPLLGYASKAGLDANPFAYIGYTLWWLLPTLMIVTAVGMFLTVLTDTPIAIAVQLFWWFAAINGTELTGDAKLLGLMVRSNSSVGYDLMQQDFNMLIANRLIMAVLALVLVGLTIMVYEQKRRGRLDFGTKISKLLHFGKK